MTSLVGNLFVPQMTESFACDADGNLTTDGRWTYSWDAQTHNEGPNPDLRNRLLCAGEGWQPKQAQLMTRWSNGRPKSTANCCPPTSTSSANTSATTFRSLSASS